MIVLFLESKSPLDEQAFCFAERVMGLEPTNTCLGSKCLTTWRHPQKTCANYIIRAPINVPILKGFNNSQSGSASSINFVDAADLLRQKSTSL